MLHLAAFLVIGVLVGLIVVLGWRPGRGGRAAGFVGAVVGGVGGGCLLYHGDAAGHHRFLSLISSALLAATAGAAARTLGRRRAGMRRDASEGV